MKRSLRHKMIAQSVHSSGTMNVSALADLAGVSEITIRRDLAELADRGVIRRTPGGASRALKEGEPVPFATRFAADRASKTAIGVAAALQVNDYEAVIIDNGTTAYAVALELAGRPITALALSLHAAVALGAKVGTQIVVPGGVVAPDTLALNGSDSLAAVRAMQADVFILGPCGITADGGLASSDYEEAQIKRAAIEASQRTILVASGDKLNRTSNFRFGRGTEISQLITTPDADRTTLQAFEDDGVEILFV